MRELVSSGMLWESLDWRKQESEWVTFLGMPLHKRWEMPIVHFFQKHGEVGFKGMPG